MHREPTRYLDGFEEGPGFPRHKATISSKAHNYICHVVSFQVRHRGLGKFGGSRVG